MTLYESVVVSSFAIHVVTDALEDSGGYLPTNRVFGQNGLLRSHSGREPSYKLIPSLKREYAAFGCAGT